MAKLNDKKRKEIIAAVASGESRRSVAKRYHVSEYFVRKAIEGDPIFSQKIAQKKEENARAVLDYMDGRTDDVCRILGIGLDTLLKPEVFRNASLPQITTAMGTLIDKWAMLDKIKNETDTKTSVEDDPLTKSLKETMEKHDAERKAGKNP